VRAEQAAEVPDRGLEERRLLVLRAGASVAGTREDTKGGRTPASWKVARSTTGIARASSSSRRMRTIVSSASKSVTPQPLKLLCA
jgi:hypothetical protein